MHRIRNERQLEELCGRFAADASSADRILPEYPALIVQQIVRGPLERVQAVFANGTLVALHSYRQLIEGPGGGDVLKESTHRPAVILHLQAIGERLRWHGALAFDYILEGGEPERPRYIDASPRLLEPVNALLGGVNLAETLVRVALGENPGPMATGRPGVRTRLGIPGLLERAATTHSRRAIIGDLFAQIRARDRYAGSTEELTPYADDLKSAIPLIGVFVGLLLRPSATTDISRATIESYALGPRGYQFVDGLCPSYRK
jgi:hypothetical protein